MSLVLNNRAQFSVLLGLNTFFSSPVQKNFVTLTLASALVSHFKVLHQSFYIMGKALSGELSCTGTGLVSLLLDTTYTI